MKQKLKYIAPLILAALVVSGAHFYSADKRPLAFVQKFKPSVRVQAKGKVNDVKKRGKPLYNGDTLRTDKNGFALVQFMDKSLAKVRPNSRLIVQGEVEGKNNTSTRIGLELGEIFLNVSKQGKDNFEVATNTSVASVKGTQFGASANNYFWVKEGRVQVLASSTGRSVTLGPQEYGQVQQDGSIETGELSEEEMDKHDKKYSQMNEKMEPKVYKLRFTDENGQQRVIEVKVYENEQ